MRREKKSLFAEAQRERTIEREREKENKKKQEDAKRRASERVGYLGGFPLRYARLCYGPVRHCLSNHPISTWRRTTEKDDERK